MWLQQIKLNPILCPVLLFLLFFLFSLLVSICDSARARSVPKRMFNISGSIWHGPQLPIICWISKMVTFLVRVQRTMTKTLPAQQLPPCYSSWLPSLSTTQAPSPYPPRNKIKQEQKQEVAYRRLRTLDTRTSMQDINSTVMLSLRVRTTHL